MGRFSDIIDEIGSEATSDGFKQNLSAVEDIQPDREAETVKLANDFKTTPEFVRSNFDSFKKKHLEAQTNVDAFTATAPKSAEWAAKDPSNTALVKDNLPALKSIENSVNKHGVLKNSYKAINSGLWNTLGGFVGFQELSIDTLNTYIYNPILKRFGYAPAKTGAETIKGTALEDFRKFAKGAAESERSELPASVSKDLAEQFKKGDISGVGSNLYYNALLSSSNTAIGALAAYISGGAAGGLLASGSAMLASSSGQKYEELQGQVADEAQAGSEVAAPKLTREQAIGSALTTGSIDALTESMFGSFQGIKRAISPVAASLTKSVGVNGTKEILKQFSFNVGKQALEEGPIEEGTASLLTNLSDYIYGVSDDLSTKKLIKDWVTSSAYGAVAGGMMTGPAATMVAMQQRAQAKQAQLNKETLLALGPEFTNSKLKERLPEKHREYVAEVTKGKPIENIYVPKEKFDAFFQDQGGSAAEAANLIGIEKSYDESNTTGIVKIPLADWATRIVGTPTEQGLINDTKFSPEEMTVNESVEAKSQAQELYAEVSKKEEADKVIKTATREIEKDIAVKLEPIYGKATSTDMAKTWAKSYAVRARDVYAGENPLDVYKREGLKILGMEALPEGVRALEQRDDWKNKGYSFVQDGSLESEFFVRVNDKEGNEVGSASFINKGKNIVPQSVIVKGENQRQGLANQLYIRAEELSGKVLKPSKNQSTIAKKFWAQKNRPFGNEKDLKKKLLFQADKRSQIRGFFDPVARLMGLIKGEANVSTALHEMGHVWLEQAKLDYNYLKSQETLNEDQQAYVKRADDLLKFLEVNSFEDIKREQHEKFAAAAESYFLRGVAPSKSLEQIFSRLKTWMVEIYRDLKSLVAQRGEGANLNPEVIDFFDRLLATEDELMEAQSNYPELFGDSIPEDVANKWYKASSDAAEAGTALILKPVMADFERKKQKLYRDEKKQVKENLFNAIKERAEQKALDALNDPQVKDLPDEIKAEMFGFKNTQDFNTAIEKARADRGSNLDAQVESEMKLRYPDSLDKLEEKAIEAVNNDKLKDKLLLEKDYIKTKFSSPEVAARLIRDLPNIKAIKSEAEVRILNKTVREINPRTYDLASRKAARDAARSYKEFERAKGVNEKDEALRKAFDFKKQQILNHEMFKAAIKARAEIEAKRKDYKKFFKSNADLSDRRNIDYINTGRAILAEYGLGRSDKTADEYLQSTKKYDKDTYESLIALVKDATRGANNYKEVSFGKFSQMTKAVDALWSISRSSEVQTVEGQKVEREKAVAEMKAKADTHLKDKSFKKGYETAGNKHGGFKTAYMKLKSALVRVEAWVDVMDLGDIQGPFRKYIFEPMNAAVIKYLNKKNATLETFAKMLTEHGKTIKDPKMLIVADELQTWDAQDEQYKPFQFTKMQLLMAVLHTGNKSNKSKLLRGYGWGVETDGILDTSKWDAFINRMIDTNVLTKEDFDFAQSVWDLMDSFKAETQKAHYEIEGYYFEEISSESFTNKYGAYRGGYVPAKLDVYAEPDAAKREEVEIFEKNNPSMAFPTTGKGATMSRNEAFARRLSLDLNLLGSHMDWALRYSFLEPRAREVSRLINDRSMKDLLQSVDPTIYSALTAWLQRTAQQRIEVPSTNLLIKAIDPMARYIRTSAAMQVMFGNLTNALQQSTGLVVAMAKVHPRYIASGVLDYLSGFDGKKNKLVEDIISKSEFMNNLQGQNIYELQNAVQEVLVNPNVFQKTQEFSMKHAYVLQTMAQNFVNIAVWQGAYSEAVKNKMSEKDAIKQADSIVRLTQGTNRTVDVAAYEQNSPTARLFIQFAGYFNMLLNLNAGEAAKIIKTVGARKGGGKLFYLYMTGFMLPAVLAGSIVKLMKGTGFDEDDDGEYTDDLLALFAGEQFKTATAMVPALGQLATATYNKAFTDQLYDDRLNMSLALSSLEQTLGFPFELYKDIKDETVEAGKLTKDAMTFMGIITATPLTQAGKSMKYLIDVSEGNVAPSGVLDFTRGVVTGKSGEQ